MEKSIIMPKTAQGIKYKNTFIQSTRLGVNRLAATRIRARYIQECLDIYLKDSSDLALHWAWDCVDELIYLFKHAGYSELPKENNCSQITDEMKQRALDYPVTSLIDFKDNKRAIAWCHNDNSPSLVYFAKNNKIWCPVCNKAYNSIDLLMHLEGCGYFDAIRRLCAC